MNPAAGRLLVPLTAFPYAAAAFAFHSQTATVVVDDSISDPVLELDNKIVTGSEHELIYALAKTYAIDATSTKV